MQLSFVYIFIVLQPIPTQTYAFETFAPAKTRSSLNIISGSVYSRFFVLFSDIFLCSYFHVFFFSIAFFP